jgi:hypothetical protein
MDESKPLERTTAGPERNVAASSAEIERMAADLAAIDPTDSAAVVAALRGVVAPVLLVLAQRALGLYVGERVTRKGLVHRFFLDPDSKSAAMLLDRALGPVVGAVGGDTDGATASNYIINLIHGVPPAEFAAFLDSTGQAAPEVVDVVATPAPDSASPISQDASSKTA